MKQYCKLVQHTLIYGQDFFQNFKILAINENTKSWQSVALSFSHKCQGIPKLNCWIDTDFVGLYSKKTLKDPTSIWLQAGYVIALVGENPVVWQHKLQLDCPIKNICCVHCPISSKAIITYHPLTQHSSWVH